MILALDLGTHTGWAAYQAGDFVGSGVWDLSRATAKPEDIRRPAELFEQLRAALVRLKPSRVAFERVNNLRGMAAVRVYYQLETVLLLECHYRGIPLIPVSPAAVKRVATGKGNADKTQMAVAAARRWPGWTPAREDEVDARFVALAALEVLSGRASAVSRPRRKKREAA